MLLTLPAGFTNRQLRQHVADILGGVTRSGEPLCRTGGEEFLLICPTTTLDEAVHAAERLRTAVTRNPFASAHLEIPVTVSAGVAARGGAATTAEELVSRADAALYAAKHGGRNRVCADCQEASAGPWVSSPGGG